MLWGLRNAILVEKKMPKMISKKVYISRWGGVKANLEKVYILIFLWLLLVAGAAKNSEKKMLLRKLSK